MAQQTLAFDGYIRVSKVAGRSGASYRSPGDQRATIDRLAKFHGLTLGEIVTEEDVSGSKKTTDRELGRLVQKVLDGESGGIIVWKVSRFSRNLVDGVTQVGAITHAGGRVIGEDLDTAQPMGKAMLGFLLGYAEEELDARRAGWKRAVDGAIERGVYVGATPVGFDRNEDSTLRRNKDAEAVRQVFLGRNRGRSWNMLASDLEAAEVKTATGKDRWHMNSVRSLIQNPIYKGTLVNGHEHFFAEYAIVTGDEWTTAQAKHAQAGPPRRDHGKWSLLSGLVICEGCAHRMSPTKDARGYSYYRCQYRACDARARADADELEGLVVGEALGEFARRISIAGVGSETDVEKTTTLEDSLRRAKAAERRAIARLDPEDAEDAETLEGLAAEVESAKAALHIERKRSRRFPTIEEVTTILESGTVEEKREALRRIVLEVRIERVGTRLRDEFRSEQWTAEDVPPPEAYEPSKSLADRIETVWR
jgi:DNA invertase Pin-like site-specific DNA recombinase